MAQGDVNLWTSSVWNALVPEAARVAVSTVSNAVGAIVAEDGRLVLPLLAQPLSSVVAISANSRCLYCP